MPKPITIIALTCLLVTGAIVTGMLARYSTPSVQAETASPLAERAISNKQSKTDRLVVATAALASFEPAETSALGDQMRMSFAPDTELAPPKVAPPKNAAPPAPKPKLAVKPQPPKPNALLNEEQIANIKQRLKLSSAQEYYWPAVEDALRAVARRIHATHKIDPNAAVAPIDPDAEEVQQLKSAAMPLLFQLREDQKQEVRTLARLIGLEKVAAQI
jgi:hypothetical protein